MNQEVFDAMIGEIKEIASDISSYARSASRMRTRGREELIDGYIDALSESCSELNELIIGLKEIRK